jgi:hypothetical protein
MPTRPLIISGTATDAEGNIASASVSVSVDEPTLFGSSVVTSDGVNHYDGFDALFGDIKISRTYCAVNKDPSPYVTKFSGQDASHDAASAVSFKYYPADVLAGTKDAVISSIFSGMPPGRVRWWTYWHEPDSEIYGSTPVFSAADYRAAFVYINALAEAYVPAGVNARAFLCLEEYSMRPASDRGPGTPRPFASFYPGDFIQALGFDCYSGFNEATPYVEQPSNQFDKLLALGQQYGKPIAIPEFGCSATAPPNSGTSRGQWMTNALRYLRPHADEVAFICWWNDQYSDLSSYPADAGIWKNMCLNGWAGTP